MARRAGQNDVTGRIRPAGRRLPDGDVDLSVSMATNKMAAILIKKDQFEFNITNY